MLKDHPPRRSPKQSRTTPARFTCLFVSNVTLSPRFVLSDVSGSSPTPQDVPRDTTQDTVSHSNETTGKTIPFPFHSDRVPGFSICMMHITRNGTGNQLYEHPGKSHIFCVVLCCADFFSFSGNLWRKKEGRVSFKLSAKS